MIPMRDGVKLFTAVYLPRDTTKKYPILMKRTPYSVRPVWRRQVSRRRSARASTSSRPATSSSIRMSAGGSCPKASSCRSRRTWPNKQRPSDVDESSDTYDTIEWLLKERRRDTTAASGMYGISYPGFYCSAGMIDAHPALKAVSPQAPVGDWYFDDFLHNGAFFLAHAYRWLGNNAQTRGKPTTEQAQAGRVSHARRLRAVPRSRARWRTSTSSSSRTPCRSGTT